MTPKAWLIIGAELLLSLLLIYILLGQISSEKKRADEATSLAKQRQETIKDMTVRQRDVATLDAKYTGELADAKKQLEDLQRCVRTGKCGLRVNAKCPANGTASAPGMDDATSPRLTDAAERDYFTLRERIDTITKQLTGLQAYVRNQCLK
ncbi:lysis protein [Phytobacter diazotrophicus]|uniref:lysis protein n=1 Tax=Phytobacter diazotrophicus TaxID=395631 RepID=UPI00232C02F4|nr:lysis protein [Phytobacter diazotrophicus]MDC0726577.1 lysis protein [Phytobacter diazotrophicus]MDC0733868.1 lysis protein [Phytobacter diazotrophicus]